MAQTAEFRDWCALLQKRTGSGQAWNGIYKDRWNGFLERLGFKLMVEIIEDINFSNVEYAIRVLETYEIRLNEEEWEKFKAKMRLETVLTRSKEGVAVFNPEESLRRIQRNTGLPRGPEAQVFAIKWGLEL